MSIVVIVTSLVANTGSGLYKGSNISSRKEWINEPIYQMLSGEVSKSDKLTLGGEAIAKGSFPHGGDASSSQVFSEPRNTFHLC